MAKKAAKKTSRKVSKGGKKGVKAKARPVRKPARKATKTSSTIPKENPSTVTTGSGPSPAEIGADLVAMFNRGEYQQIEEKYWSPAIVSVEGSAKMAWHGRDAVIGKNQWWMQDHAMKAARTDGLFIGASGFAVKFIIDVETKSTGAVETMTEIGVYTVKDGKIIREEFMGLAG